MARKIFQDKAPQKEAQALFARVYEATGCKTQVELSTFLGITQSTISDSQRRGTVPPEWLLKLLLQHNINPVWVLTGKHSQKLYVNSQSKPDTSASTPSLTEEKTNSQHDTLETYHTEDLLAEVARRVMLRV